MMHGGAVVLAGQLFNRAAALLVTLVAARTLAQDDFASYALATNLALFAAAFALPGIDAEIIRSEGRAVHRVMAFKAPIAATAAIGLALFAAIPLQYSLPLVTLALISGFSQGFAETPESVLIVKGRLWARAVVQAVPAALGLLMACFTNFILGAGLWALLTVVAARDLTRLLGGGLISRSRVSTIERRIASGSEKALAPLAILTIFGYVYYRVDVMVLGIVANDTDVAMYAGAFLVVLAIQNVPSALGPLFLRELISRPGAWARIVAIQFMMGIASALIVFLFAEEIIELLFGQDYDDSVTLVRVLALALPALFASSALLRVIMAQGHDVALAVLLAAVCALSVVVQFGLAMSLGALGSAIASVIIEFALLIGLALTFRRAARRSS